MVLENFSQSHSQEFATCCWCISKCYTVTDEEKKQGVFFNPILFREISVSDWLTRRHVTNRGSGIIFEKED